MALTQVGHQPDSHPGNRDREQPPETLTAPSTLRLEHMEASTNLVRGSERLCQDFVDIPHRKEADMMRLNASHSDPSEEARANTRLRREDRGLGPFSGRQLTTMICVAMLAIVAIPTVALPATVANTSSTPAVLKSGQSESGIFGVSANVGIAGDFIGVGITFPQPLAKPINDGSHSPSGTTNMIATLTGTPVAHCPGLGHAARGYLCLYLARGPANYTIDNQTFSQQDFGSVGRTGAEVVFNVDHAGDTDLWGSYTVTAP